MIEDVLGNRRAWGVGIGDAVKSLRAMPANSVQCCVTSPPYFGLRSYLPAGHPDKTKEIGLEETPEAYIARMVGVFAEVKRVLRSDGVLWVNIGDSYAGGGGGNYSKGDKNNSGQNVTNVRNRPTWLQATGLKAKDRIGIPHMLAFALRADGWYWRDECVWRKPNTMPGSMRDRTTAAHEFVFMFSKNARYFYDQEAIREKAVGGQSGNAAKFKRTGSKRETPIHGQGYGTHRPDRPDASYSGEARNKRSVWSIPTRGYKGSHYAVFPPALVAPCILAGTSAKGCCPACGSPWVRVVARKRVATRPGKETKVTGDTMTDGNRDPQRHVTSTETTGWAQACKCEPLQPIPCLVLDPFVGSGTTLAVADFYGRRGIGLDLDDRNIKLIEQRMAESKTILLDKKAVKKKAVTPEPDIGFQRTILELLDTPRAGNETESRARTELSEVLP